MSKHDEWVMEKNDCIKRKMLFKRGKAAQELEAYITSDLYGDLILYPLYDFAQEAEFEIIRRGLKPEQMGGLFAKLQLEMAIKHGHSGGSQHMVTSALCKFWKYGEALRNWHNEKIRNRNMAA